MTSGEHQRFGCKPRQPVSAAAGFLGKNLCSNDGSSLNNTTYRQTFVFNNIGNMEKKTSSSYISDPIQIGANLNYDFDYSYFPETRKARQIGNRHYNYDLNGNLIAEREGGPAVNPEVYRPYYRDGDLFWTEYGFGFVAADAGQTDTGAYQRNYRWNERNLMTESSDNRYTVQYRYGNDGQRALKYVVNNGQFTAYFNNMWHVSNAMTNWLQNKHIYVGETRIATKINSADNDNLQAERRRIYYYHSDHLGSAQTVTNWQGDLHERLEYTPYGELWIDWISNTAPQDGTPFRFTGKELDAETGLYYYGARYLDPRVSRWLSGDPAMYQGDYLPSAPNSRKARIRNASLPGISGIFNTINFHVYGYSLNNPIRYFDPDGRLPEDQATEDAARNLCSMTMIFDSNTSKY